KSKTCSSPPSANTCARNGTSRERSKPACNAAVSAPQSSPSLTAPTKTRTRPASTAKTSCRATPSRSGKIVRRLSWRSTTSPTPPSQPPHPHPPPNPTPQRDHVAPAPPLQPLQKPQPALPIRQRHLARTLNRSQRRTRRSRIPQPINQPSHRRRLEQAADRNLNIKARTDAADQTRRQQRMAPKPNKGILNPNPLQSQHLGKQRAQQLLSRIARQTNNPSPNLRRRQRRAVKLPVRRQRQALQYNDR